MKLRGKYPPASPSHRGSILGSDTNSLGNSKVWPSQPTNSIMSPKPNWHGPPDAALVKHAPLHSEDTELTMEGSTPKYPSTSQWVTSSSEFYRQTTFASSNYANEDFTITGSSRSKRTLGKKAPDPSVSMYRLQGILKRDLADSNQSLTSEMDRDDSTMTLKERLHKNKATLRALLSEEHNPLYKMKLRAQADLNKSFESDMTRIEQGDLTFSMEASHRDLTLQTGPNPNSDKNGPLQIQTEPQEHLDMGEKDIGPRGLSGDLKALSIAHGGLTQRSLADWPQRKHNGTKRYISPDSSHDSAVDVDTTSLQSSPGSSDTQLTVIPRHNHRMANLRHRHNGKGTSLPPSGGSVKQRVGGGVLDNHQVSPRDTQLQLPLGGTHNNKADSDVDSGIAQGPVGSWLYPGRAHRDRRDSSSSTENDPELDNLLSDSRIQNGSQFNSLSSQDIRTAHRTRQDHGSSGAMYGPVKADHALYPPSPRHSNREDMLDRNEGLHPRHPGMSASMQDLTQQKRASPINRVRFEDEVSEGDLPLGHHHRASSHQELTMDTEGTLHHRRPPRIPSGCRAQKLRAGRKGASTSNLLSPYHEDYGSYQPYLDTNPSEHEARILGLPPSGKVEDLKMKIQQLRTRAMTPTEVIHAVASDSRVPVTTNLPVHRATPVIITQNGSSHRDDTQSYLSDTLSSENDLNNEVAQFNGFNDAWTNALEVQNSKKPRKRDKEFKQDSSDNTDSVHSQRVTKPRRVQTSSGLHKHHSDVQYGQGRSKGRLPDRPGSSAADMRSSSAQAERPVIHHRESPYEEVNSVRDRQQQKHTHYEEVHVHRQEQDRNQDQHTYAVPQKPPRPRARKASNPCVVTTYDDSIHQEDVPPIPERGYRSDLERYKELSGSRTSLSDKVDSFRKAAKNKWSALRRAVSLERVDKEGSEESTLSRLKKSPSLQSLAQKFSSKRKGRARFSEVETSVSSSPRFRHRPSRPSSAPLGRSRKHSISLTSLAAPVDAPKNFRPIGRLKKVYPDGAQLLELVRPPHGPFGFYIARGTATYGGGIFVSRLSDGLPEHFFAGLLGVGDEVLEINGQFITNLTLDEVYSIMSQHQHLLIKTLPYMARVDT